MENTTFRKSRKKWMCEYCWKEIPKGTFYFNVKITPWCHYDNESFDVWAIHSGCKEAGDDYYWDDCQGGIFPDNGLSSDFIEFRDNVYKKKEREINGLGCNHV